MSSQVRALLTDSLLRDNTAYLPTQTTKFHDTATLFSVPAYLRERDPRPRLLFDLLHLEPSRAHKCAHAPNRHLDHNGVRPVALAEHAEVVPAHLKKRNKKEVRRDGEWTGGRGGRENRTGVMSRNYLDKASGGSTRRRGGWENRREGKHPQRTCLLYTSPSPRDLSTSRIPSSA